MELHIQEVTNYGCLMIRSFNKYSSVIQTQFDFMLAAESFLPLYIISILNYVVLLSEDNC